MAKYRRDRINDEVKKELSMILREVKDPRLANAFISITAVDVTGDLKFAKVYYSAMQGDKKEVAAGLRSCAGFIRREVARSKMGKSLSFFSGQFFRNNVAQSSNLIIFRLFPDHFQMAVAHDSQTNDADSDWCHKEYLQKLIDVLVFC